MFTRSEDERYQALQRALEAPINVGRRTMQVLAELGMPCAITDDRKPAVTQKFQEVFTGSPLLRRFNHLLQRDRDYNVYLQFALRGEVSQEDYEATIHTFARECIPTAYAWTIELNRFYHRFLEGDNKTKEGSSVSSNRERYY